MIYQIDTLDWHIVLEPFLSILILIVLMLIMVIIYRYIRIWLAILVLFLFSLIIGINSIGIENIPFNPYISIFFILFQSIFFILMSLKVYKR